MKRFLFSVAAAASLAMPLTAQRVMDKLDRGLVAVKADAGVFVSWRVFGEDPDDLKFNLYRDGTLVNKTPLSVSNFTDTDGSPTSTYTVRTVINGIEGEPSKTFEALSNDYLEIPITPLPSADYEPNDATIADLDGDGEMEVIIKLRSLSDIRNAYPYDATEFDAIHAYKLDGTLLWWIHVGPNMVDFQSNEVNIAAYDWDCDGRAECILRGGDGMVIHMADGTEYVVGDPTKNTRNQLGQGGGGHFTRLGNEYLIYMDGLTGKPYEVTDYPLPRFEKGETDLDAAWGDGYGHRSNKHFYGAPYLDGRKPSIFIARGIYTRHKMIAYDVDPATHKLTERWRWVNNTPGSPWYGQGYHNYTVADVDWDGRDEIVFGSMVIDDNGKGLSTTGLGHGDSHHVGDFNPYIYRSEIVACNEDRPNNNYRDATTSKIYYRTTGGDDDGRAIAGNFSNDYPGAQFITARDSQSLISTVTNGHIDGASPTWDVAENFRIFWDGDLLDETFNYQNGKNTAGTIYKFKQGAIKVFDGTMTNNDTKGTPCMQADIFGDWREEVIMRTADNKAIRIYTTTIPTEHRLYTLLHDPQYRNAMVWQMNGYNQTPHVSYFLGELEGITQAPPAPTMTGREEVKGSISGNGKIFVFAETGDATATVIDGASPALFVDNTPTWVQGNGDNDNIKYESYTHTLTGGGFAGDMKLVKLGGGVLVLPNTSQRYSGNTEIWDGTVVFNGEMPNSHVWINRFGSLSSDGGKFPKGVEMNYASVLTVGSDVKAGSVEIGELKLGFGSRINIDLFSDGSADKIEASKIFIEKKDWENGPEYSTPVIVFTTHPASGETKIPAGDYVIANVGEVDGNISDFVIEGLNGLKANLKYADGKLILSVSDTRAAADVLWTGDESSNWELSEALNFKILDSGEPTAFVAGDRVIFDDSSAITDITIPNGIYPSKIIFNNSEKTIKITGAGFEGECEIEKKGTGRAILNNTSSFKGKTYVYNGVLEVNTLGANEGNATGALGHYSNEIILDKGGVLAVAKTGKSSHDIVSTEGGIEVINGELTIIGASVKGNGLLVKRGKGTLNLAAACEIDTLRIDEGAVYDEGDSHAVGKTVVFNGKNVELIHNDSRYSYSTDNAAYVVNEGATAKLTLDGRCAYKGSLKGKGSIEVYAPWIRNTLEGNWSEFEGLLTATQRPKGGGSDYGSSFDFNSSKGLDKAKLTVNAATTFNISRQSINVGALSGTGVFGNEGKTFVIAGNGEDSYINGTFGSNVNVEKNGPEYLTINKAQPNMGAMTINEGILELNSTDPNIGTMTGVNPMVVKATITGSGVCGNSEVTMTSTSTLAPNNSKKSAKYRTIAFLGDLTIEEGGMYTAEIIAIDKYSNISVAGRLHNAGEVKVELNGYTPSIGDEFILWTATEAEGTPKLTLPELPEGFLWNVAEVTPTEGKISVTDVNAVIEIEASKLADCSIYNLSGQRLKIFSSTVGEALQTVRDMGKGIYILHYTTDGVTRSIKLEN